MSVPLDGLSVLIVEDQFILALGLEATVRDAGASDVEIASHLSDAHRIVEAASFDAAILDIRLADGHSLPLAQELMRGGVPVVIHSGHANLGHAEIVPDAVFLPKPSTPAQIVEALLEARKAA